MLAMDALGLPEEEIIPDKSLDSFVHTDENRRQIEKLS